jgi:opacity protein-like surface antigen
MAALLTATMTSTASAAEPDAENRVKGKLRFHIDTDFFGWQQRSAFTDGPNQNPSKSNQIGFGFARPLAGEADIGALLATGNSMFGLGLGYGISRHLILGARLGLSLDHRYNPSSGPVTLTQNFFSTNFTPYLEIVLLPKRRVTPFILVRGGFQAGTAALRATLHDPGVGDLTNLDRTSLIAPTIGIGAGAHFLITDRFSLDASLMFDYRWYFGREHTADANRPKITTDWHKTYQSFSIGAVLGFSVWFL